MQELAQPELRLGDSAGEKLYWPGGCDSHCLEGPALHSSSVRHEQAKESY